MTTFPTHTSPCFAARDDAGALLFAEAGSGGHDSQAVGMPAAVVGGGARVALTPVTSPTATTPLAARARAL